MRIFGYAASQHGKMAQKLHHLHLHPLKMTYPPSAVHFNLVPDTPNRVQCSVSSWSNFRHCVKHRVVCAHLQFEHDHLFPTSKLQSSSWKIEFSARLSKGKECVITTVATSKALVSSVSTKQPFKPSSWRQNFPFPSCREATLELFTFSIHPHEPSLHL